ncbi:MAG: mechanosensitive ion channel family protein [Bacteroidetes bacterium]|jgi:small conductance mechanosensitive channel|nr:mechanosensitive ion channel family protein [Bacteroidota bacterium]
MFYFLDTTAGVKSLIPNVKEKIAEHHSRLSDWFDSFVNSLAEYTPKVIAAIIVLLIGLWVVKRIAILAEKAMIKKELEISLRTFLKSLLSIGLKIILIVTVAGMMGIGTASFVTILGAASLAIGLALQGSLSNFAGGVLILIFKPFKVGDSIEAQGQTGEVKEIQIFNTILLTGDHKTVILPNGPLSNGTIVNTTRFGNLRTEIALMVSNDNSIDKVKEVIHNVLDANEKVIKDIEPGIFIGKVADGSVAVTVRPYCLPGDTAQVTSELYYQIYKAFETHKIKLPPTIRIVSTN